MNILKEIFNLPNTSGGRKRRYNLLNRLGIEKRDKAVVSKEIESGELGGGGADEDALKVSYYIVDTREGEEMILSTLRNLCYYYNMFGYKFSESGTDEYVRRYDIMAAHCISSENPKIYSAFEFVAKFATIEIENIKVNNLEEFINGIAGGDEDAYNAVIAHVKRVDKETFYKYIKENGYL